MRPMRMDVHDQLDVVDAPWYQRILGNAVESHTAMEKQLSDVLILTSSTGVGHDSVATALQEAIQAMAPEVGVRVLDPLSGRNGSGPMSPGRWYDAVVAHAPWLW